MNNPIQTLNDLKSFMGSYRGNAQQEAMQRIQNSGMSQQQLNELQQQANSIYSLAQKMGLLK